MCFLACVMCDSAASALALLEDFVALSSSFFSERQLGAGYHHGNGPAWPSWADLGLGADTKRNAFRIPLSPIVYHVFSVFKRAIKSFFKWVYLCRQFIFSMSMVFVFSMSRVFIFSMCSVWFF